MQPLACLHSGNGYHWLVYPFIRLYRVTGLDPVHYIIQKEYPPGIPKALQLKKLLESVPGKECTTTTPLSAWYLYDGYIIARQENLRMALEFLRSDENVRSSYPDVLTQQYTGGTLVLNAPVGSREFCEVSFTANVRSLEQLLDDVAALGNSHVSFTPLKFCHGVCKINFFPRVTPPDSTASGAALFDNLLEECMRRILGGALDSEVFKELQLPMKTNPEHPHIGIRLTSAWGTAASAFLSSASGRNKILEMALTSSAVKRFGQYYFAEDAYDAWALQHLSNRARSNISHLRVWVPRQMT